VSDEHQLQITRKDDESSLVPSSARSSLVTRGRRDAALLALHARAESEERRSGLLGWPALWDQIEKPTEEVQRDAEQGHAPAQFNLGWRYDNRHLGVPGVGQDYAEAAKWYHRAADQGLAPA
jgi:TPR repeat protein